MFKTRSMQNPKILKIRMDALRLSADSPRLSEGLIAHKTLGVIYVYLETSILLMKLQGWAARKTINPTVS